jgi:type III secretion protein W
MPGPDEIHSITPSEPTHVKGQKIQQAQATNKLVAAQVPALEEFVTDVAFNPISVMRRFQQLETKTGRREQLTEEKESEEMLEVKKSEELSFNYQRRNQELDSERLLRLKRSISARNSQEEILKKVLEAFADHTLADEALDFLIESTKEGELADKLKGAKKDLNIQHGREVRAGRNVNSVAQSYASQGVDSPTALRDMYRDITGNPRDASTLFDELSKKYPFEKLRFVIAFLLHSLGQDMKSKGPSIARAELHRLFSDTRSLQAILGVYRFFRSRMRLIFSSFEREGEPYPKRVTYEVLARLFMKFLQDRYPSAEKVIQFGALLGIPDDLIAQIIFYTQMRDGVRQVAPRLFKSEQHRQDVLMAFIEALGDLEEEMEKKQKEKEKEDKEKEKEE